MEQYKLVFSGDILPGHDPDTVKARLLELLRVPPERAERLFSGKPVVIKKGLDADTAQAYRRKLASMGVGIQVSAADAPAAMPTPPASATPTLALEPMSSPADADAEAPPPAPGAEASVTADMQCPECGRWQPKRTLCLNCGVDMPRILAAREAQAEEARAMRANGGLDAAASIRVSEHAPLHEDAPARPPYFGLSFEGRMSRRTYLTAWSLLTTALFLLALPLAVMGAPWLMLPVAVVYLVMALRVSVLRTHDFNWAGWWVLLTLVPLVGVVFSLLLLFFPGSPDENDYGEKPEPTGWGHTLGAVAASVLLPVAVALIAPMFVAQSLSQFSGQPNPYLADGGAMSASMDLSGYDPALNDLVMYSLTTCGYCAQKRAQFDTLGVHYIEVFIDEDQGALQALQTKLQAQGFGGGAIGTPTIEINGVMLPNNPSLDQIATHFYRRRT
jgi:uncharacterized membrane protein YhaH (DUF805 family)/glutaredoxin